MKEVRACEMIQVSVFDKLDTCPVAFCKMLIKASLFGAVGCMKFESGLWIGYEFDFDGSFHNKQYCKAYCKAWKRQRNSQGNERRIANERS